MEYNNYFTENDAPPYFFGFGTDSSQLQQNMNNDPNGQFRIDTLNSTNLMQNNFEYSALHTDNGMTAIPPSKHSPGRQLSLLPNNSVDSGIALELDTDIPMERRGSSEEKDSLTPAQSRRKAQNRAAQRAFRERKERHVRDLEARLNLLTTTTSSLQSDNERLKLLLQKAQTENEILRASAATSPTTQSHANYPDTAASWSARSSVSDEEPTIPDPACLGLGLVCTEPSFCSKLPPSTHSQLLSPAATWDLLQSHPRYLSGAVDLSRVCDHLKRMARSNGSGPMFDEDEVRRMIDDAGRGGADELI